ncbi:hypothetical protein [Brevibacillus laterosporus]|uniref:hypothetical protein n=1 Tax=Brevibacillus laterosporus TaxID=1465 RepID=UPI00144473FC|nr:hypothetical protein [Brevibacillus laterosporus]NKQ19806.1 hypothetical protein [Brevibacillus laterosporus]WNX30356.1 hypothetical protein RWW94_19380 [Brevibacillus laterosporus]
MALLIIPFSAQAAKESAVPNPEYPGTTLSMKVGDVLYSSKTLGGSTQIVGHVGIIGPDFLVYHVTPATGTKGGGVADTITNYMSRHGKGETIEVYQYRSSSSANAAKWAKNNYSRVTEYKISIAKLSQKNPNYCSKFLWQAFYYGAGEDIVGYDLSDTQVTTIHPWHFTTDEFVKRGSFKAK